MLALILALAETKKTPLPDGWVRVQTPSYTIEVPAGWEVGEETSFGQREIERGADKMSAMTANMGPAKPTKETWDRLYQTSLFFIRRSDTKGGEPTPYQLSKSKQGYDACSFGMKKDGFLYKRYVLLRAPSGKLLALGVEIPDKTRERELARAFERMVRTAVIPPV